MTHLIDLDEVIERQSSYIAAIKSYGFSENAEEMATAQKDLAMVLDLKSRILPTTLPGTNDDGSPSTTRRMSAAAPTPPVTGSADGNLEPGPALPNGLIGGRNVNNRLTALEEASINVNRLYGLLKGRLDGVDEDHTELAGQVQALTERFEAHSHEIDIHSTDRPTALAGQIGREVWG